VKQRRSTFNQGTVAQKGDSTDKLPLNRTEYRKIKREGQEGANGNSSSGGTHKKKEKKPKGSEGIGD